MTTKVFEHGVNYREDAIKEKSILIAQSYPFLVADTPSGIYYFECSGDITDERGKHLLWRIVELTRTLMPVVELTNKLRVMKANEVKGIFEPGEVGATLELIVSDTKTGKITEYRPPVKSKSFVRAFLELLWIQMYGINEAVGYQFRDTSNALQWTHARSTNMAIHAAIANDLYGNQVGTGIVALTINDYALGTKIAHGVAAGQLQYSAMTFGAPASNATTSQFTATRNFANASGGNITVNEAGVVGYVSRYGQTFYALLIRDVIAGGILVPNGQTLTLNYRPQCVS